MWTTYGDGRYVASEADVIARPAVYLGRRPAVLHIHGAEGGKGAADWMAIPQRAPMFRGLTGAGFTVVSAELGGSATWGNDTGQSRIGSAYTYSQTLPDVTAGPVVLFAQSMGAVGAMIWARANRAKVAGVVLVIPVCNLSDLLSSEYAQAIHTAHGGSYSEATHGATRNPLTFAAALDGLPVQIWAGDSDALCKPADAIALAAAITTSELHLIPGGHAESTLTGVDMAAVQTFLNSLVEAS
jgi:alpha-beta hydrolase superfamily lysophospholipase